MKQIEKQVRASFFAYDELSADDRVLLYRAYDVRRRAQAPYSRYFVGAALRVPDGRIYCGCNVERCSYTQTTHAEQNAIDSMVAALGPAKIEAMAVVGWPADSTLRFPPIPGAPVSLEFHAPSCGHCLQCIWENCHADPNVRLLTLASDGLVMATTIGDALPMRFGPDALGISYGSEK